MSATPESTELGAALDIAHAAELKTVLEKRLGDEGDLLLDGRLVQRSDAAGLQLLLAFAEYARSQGRDIRWQGVSESLQDDIRGLGLAALLNIQIPSEGGQ